MSEGKDRFDVMVHLVGEQPLPNLLAMRQFDAGLHVMVVSERTRDTAEHLKHCGERVGAQVFVADPWDMDTIGRTLAEANLPGGSLAFNVTGGTKIMSFAALRFAENKGCPAFYVDTSNRRLLNLTGGGVSATLKPALSIEDFMTAHGHGVSEEGRWTETQAARADTTRKIWRNRLDLQKHQRTISEKAQKREDFEVGTPRLKASYRNREGHLEIDSVEESAARTWKDFHLYLSGGWFEEYVYILLQPLLNEGKLSDLRVNLVPAWGETPDRRDTSGIQELDVVATDGIRLFIVECKAGRVQQTHCQKIENIVDHFAGALATGVVAVAGHQNKQIADRLSSGKNYATFAGSQVKTRLAKQFLNLRPGTVYGELQASRRNVPTKKANRKKGGKR